jgi:quercetin dioxygenase-like cupin family protein
VRARLRDQPVVALAHPGGGTLSHPDGFIPRRTEKPWGYEILWAQAGDYCGKILHIEKGQLLSLQYHELKHESIYVLSGRMIFRYDDARDARNAQDAPGQLRERIMGPGDAQQVPVGRVHQFEAIETTDVLEASTNHLDDVVRLKDRYGRV